MESSDIDGYKELELFIQQAEVEIGLTLSGAKSIKGSDINNVINTTTTGTESDSDRILSEIVENDNSSTKKNYLKKSSDDNERNPVELLHGLSDISEVLDKNVTTKIIPNDKAVFDAQGCKNDTISFCRLESTDVDNDVNVRTRKFSENQIQSFDDCVIVSAFKDAKRIDNCRNENPAEESMCTCPHKLVEDLSSKNGIYDNIFRPIKEFTPLDERKLQRHHYRSERCVKISITGNPRQRSKSESCVERDSPIIFFKSKDSTNCSAPEVDHDVFEEGFTTPTFNLDSGDSDRSTTPVFNEGIFTEKCDSVNFIPDKCTEPCYTSSTCVQETLVERSDTPTFVPSVHNSENLISSTLNRYKRLHRSKTDPGFNNSLYQSVPQSHNHDPFDIDDFEYDFDLEPIPLRTSVSSSPAEFHHGDDIHNKIPCAQPKRKLSSTGVQTSFDENCNEINDKDDKLGLKKLLLIKKVSTGTNTTDSLERPKKKVKENRRMEKEKQKIQKGKENQKIEQTNDTDKVKDCKTDELEENHVGNFEVNQESGNCKETQEVDSDKTNNIMNNHDDNSTESSSHNVTQSPIKKPTNFPEELISNMSVGSFLNDESPEMQMIVNATSPVLFRRRSSNNFRTHGKFQVEGGDNHPSPLITSETKDNPFMNSDMAKTWHGITSNKWKTYYAPIMRNMLQEMNNNNQTESQDEELNQNLQYNSNSLRAKTLLDEMHKKYCSYQYKNRLQLPSPDDLILPIKLKSSPPPPNRMLSRSWIFRRYAVPTNTPSPSPSSESVESSQVVTTDTSCKDSTREVTPTDSSSKSETSAENEKQRLTPGKEDAEIEAVEACRWLKEAGFPQYSQMYEDGQFPVDILSVEKDHDFLDKDSMQPLVRRLSTLNKCAIMRISTPTRKNAEDSDDDDQCALSDKWKYQHNIRRWSRKDLNSPTSDGQPTSPVVKSSSSNDSLLTDQNSSSETGDSPVLDSKMHHNKNSTTDDYFGVKTSTPVDTGGGGTSSLALSPRLRRVASERIKGAKNFLKRVESFKSRKTRKVPRTGNVVEISGPVITDSENMREKIKHLNCKDLSPSSEEQPSPIPNGVDTSTVSVEVNVSKPIPEPWSDESTNYKTPTTKLKTPTTSVSCGALSDKTTSNYHKENSVLSTSKDFSASHNGVLPGSTGRIPHLPGWEDQSITDISEMYILPSDHKPGSFPINLEDVDDSNYGHRINYRTGSFNLGHEVCDVNSNTVVKRRGSMDPKLQVHRHSIYDNVPIEEDLQATQEDLDMILDKLFQDINGLNKTINGEDAEVLSPPSSLFNTNNSKPDNDESIDTDDSSNGNYQENDVISGTVSSPDSSSDHDIPCEEFSPDDSGEHIVYRERRDSGFGSSLTRAPSDRRRYRIRWHSFQKSHRPSIGSRNLQISNLSVCQLMVLQKLSLCRLTGLIEKYSPNRSNWTWTVPRFMKRHKVPDYSDKNVFSVPLLVTLQRTGQPLPQCILHAMRYLRKTAGDAVGIFRKSGVRSRIQKLKNDVEENAELVNFEELQAYDVADLVKQYFRELPECLLTNKLSEIFFNIFIHLPAEHRVDALQSAIFLLPDENREVLQSLLLFLSDIATHASEHQMNASNLAVCFAPSLFNMGGTKSATQSPSPRRPRKNLGVPDARELQEQGAAQLCLTTMINECKKIFMIPVSLMSKCRFSYIEQGDPVSLDEFNKKSTEEESGYQPYVENCIQGLLKESRDKSRGWISMSVPSNVDVSYKKVADGHPLRLWKCCVDVEAPPDVVLDRIKNERHTWDEDMLNWRSVEKLDNQTEIFQYVRNSMAPHPSRDYCVLRCWKTDLPKGACALISTSVEHPKAELLGGIRAVELASHYLIEPCGTGKSRITHMIRLDMRGRTPEWYKKAFGHICANLLERIRDSFKQTTEGPESTV